MAISVIQRVDADFVSEATGSVNFEYSGNLTAGSVQLATIINRGNPSGNGAPVVAQGDFYSTNQGGGNRLDWTFVATIATSDHTISVFAYPQAFAGTGGDHRQLNFDWPFGSPHLAMDMSIESTEFAHDFTAPTLSAAGASGTSGATSVARFDPGPTGVFEASPVLVYTSATWRWGNSWPILPEGEPWRSNVSPNELSPGATFTGRTSWSEESTTASVTIPWETQGGSSAAAVIVTAIVEGGSPPPSPTRRRVRDAAGNKASIRDAAGKRWEI